MRRGGQRMYPPPVPSTLRMVKNGIMRSALLTSAILLLCCAALSTAAPPCDAQTILPVVPPPIEKALGIEPLQQQLKALQQQDQGGSSAAVDLRLRILERVLRASFDVDSALGRIDTEASYVNEDAYALQIKSQRENALLNLTTIAASGALGAAGSAMQLTRDLNHAGTALQAAAGGTAIILSIVQLKGLNGGSRTVRSPYNMLAEVLDRTPNAESRYPPLIETYLQTPPAEGKPPLGEGLVAAWHKLHRLQSNKKDEGASVESVTADRTTGGKATADELANREAMLHDLHAIVILMRLDLQKVLIDAEDPKSPTTP
jgi:hypothetical protein